MSESANPYRAPNDLPAHDGAYVDADAAARLEGKYATLGRVAVTWEKLRISYNTILAFAVMVRVAFAGELSVWLPMIVMGAFMANVCFCAGPVVDGYLTWFGVRSRVITVMLFTMGTLLALLLAMLSFVAPDPF